jgi:hypothetical protein
VVSVHDDVDSPRELAEAELPTTEPPRDPDDDDVTMDGYLKDLREAWRRR